MKKNYSRRHFLETGLKIAAVSSLVSIIPQRVRALAPFFNSTEPYSFEIFKAEFQAKIKAAGLKSAIVEKLPISGNNSSNRSLSPSYSNKVITHNRLYDNHPIKEFRGYGIGDIATPAVNLITNHGFNLDGQLFDTRNNMDTGFYYGPTQWKPGYYDEANPTLYFVYPLFQKFIIGRAEYFCYGVPCSEPNIRICKYCNQEYAFQSFYYNGHSNLDANGHYKSTAQPIYSGMACSASGNGNHDNLPGKFSPLQPCQCDYNFVVPTYDNKSRYNN